MAYPNALFSTFAFIGFVMCVLPFPWHPEAWSTGVCMYMIWTGLACLNQFINSIIWTGNAIDFAPVWCDISTKLVIGTAVAIPAATLTINRRLYRISTGVLSNSVTYTKAMKRREVISDLAICLGLPLLDMALHYIVQGHRYNIFEDVGCWPTTYNTLLAYFLVFCPPVAIGCLSAMYGIRSMINMNRRRTEFNNLLSSHSNLDSNIYIRLMCLSGLEAVCTVPLGLFAVVVNIKNGGVHPWVSWQNVHFRFSRVVQVIAVSWHADPITHLSLESSRWFVIICAFTFFAFMGFSDKAMDNYRAVYMAVAGCYRRLTSSRPSFDDKDISNPKDAGINGGLQFSSNPNIRRNSTDTFSSASMYSLSSGELDVDCEKGSLHSSRTCVVPTPLTQSTIPIPEPAFTYPTSWWTMSLPPLRATTDILSTKARANSIV
ncbi:hypothetical protein D9613_002292 [Agrocybe pediades]|uniref:Pheromone receptor n=1 Tax=Agrocybe pediades TaxID=84607 RepID=A0A8H4VX50_9AGAR|nr:hypothetical protein D9613_002292 [Agrocybe pediades]